MKLTLTLASLAIALSASAAEAPLWLRNPAISPDGKTLAFTYKGDIYTVPVTGGTARQLTTNPAHDTAPVWSPDGKQIAFASTRQGSMDIYLIPADGVRQSASPPTPELKHLSASSTTTLCFSLPHACHHRPLSFRRACSRSMLSAPTVDAIISGARRR